MFELMDTAHLRPIIQIFGFGKNGQVLCDEIESREGVLGVEFIKGDEQYSTYSQLDSVVFSIEYDPKGYKQAVEDSDFNIYLVDEKDLSDEVNNIQRYVKETCLNCLLILNCHSTINTGSKKVKVLLKEINSFVSLPFNASQDADVYLINQNESAYWYVRSICELIHGPGLICFDFSDLHYVMSKMGRTVMGTFSTTGKNRAINALRSVLSSPPFQDIDLLNANNVLVILTAGMDITIREFEDVGNSIMSFVSENASVVVGTFINPNIAGKMRVTVILGAG